jgi:drug/metabolite transporter (DMT)-like permease
MMAQELTDEVLAPAQWLGIALVLIGVMALEIKGNRRI